MTFTDEIAKKAWERAGGRCECERSGHGHDGRCNRKLTWENRGQKGAFGAWEAHHRTSVQSGGENTLANCEILCILCHTKTF